jgi:hypothetical protein
MRGMPVGGELETVVADGFDRAWWRDWMGARQFIMLGNGMIRCLTAMPYQGDWGEFYSEGLVVSQGWSPDDTWEGADGR